MLAGEPVAIAGFIDHGESGPLDEVLVELANGEERTVRRDELTSMFVAALLFNRTLCNRMADAPSSPSSATRRQNACNVLICGSRKPKVGTTRHRAGERGRGAQTQIRGGGWAGKFSSSC